MRGFVYLIECSPFIKVGYSADIASRINSISNSIPHDISVLRVWDIDCERMAYDVEQAVHKQLTHEGFNHKLEWYAGSASKRAEEVIDKKILELDTQVHRLKIKLKNRRSKKRPISTLAKKEKDIRRKKKNARPIPGSRIQAIRQAVDSYRHKKAAEACGVDSKALWRFIYRDKAMTDEDLDRCHRWLSDMGHRITWIESNDSESSEGAR